MDITDAIKKSLMKIYIEPGYTHTKIMEGINQSLPIKEKEKKYYKKTIKLNIHRHFYTGGLEKLLKQNIIEFTEYNDCWVKETEHNVFHILV